MLERVPLLEKHLDDYREVAGEEAIERVRAAAAPLSGARILHVNATAYGGGVAELLATHVPLLRDLGIEAEWEVIHGSDEFFAVTKQVHNALQGAPIEWTAAMQRTYLEKVLDNALLLEGEFDYVVIHDPQPAALLALSSSSSVNGPNTKWIWRCHIDLTDANPEVWEFFRPYVEQHDASVWTMARVRPGVALDGPRRAGAAVHRPAVGEEPRSARDPSCARSRSSTASIPTGRSLCQVSRYDPWKDPLGVIEAYRIVREEIPDVQLVLAGSMATDDPEGFQVWQEVDAARDGDSRHPPAVQHPAGRQRADQRVPALGRRRDPEVAAGGLRAHGERGPLEGTAGHRRTRRWHRAPDP